MGEPHRAICKIQCSEKCAPERERERGREREREGERKHQQGVAADSADAAGVML